MVTVVPTEDCLPVQWGPGIFPVETFMFPYVLYIGSVDFNDTLLNVPFG